MATRGHVGRDGNAAAAALLGCPPPKGTVPPMWHWFHLHDVWRQDELGPDGHPLHGVPAPPAPGLRRMFAGGRTTHRRPLAVGAPAERRSTVLSTVDKQGRSGPLTFVTVRHEWVQDGRVAVEEEQDLVYRSGEPAPTTAVAEEAPAGAVEFEVDPVVLFRFSAATGNAHRIHYDLPYARSEGHADLVVHGPLQVVLMAELLRSRGADLVGTRFGYRLLRPAFGAQVLRVSTSDGPAGARVHDGAGARVAEGRVEEA